MDLKLRCSGSGCDCVNFVASTTKDSLRVCDGCSHSWMTHLLEKLMTSRDDQLSIFDVCSLALYGTHALPIRLKIVIERLLATLQPDEVDKILRSFGWNPQDLARGYMIQDPRGGLLSKWTMPPRDEEVVILQQFFRFPVTSALSFALMRDDFPLMSPGVSGHGVGGNIRPSHNFSSLFHPSLNLLGHGLNIPTTANSSSTTPTTLNNVITSANGNLSSSSSNTSLLSPKSPANHNNINNNGIVPPGSLFALNSHLNHLGGLSPFPPVSLANFQGTSINNNHSSSGQNNGKSHPHQGNNNNERTGGGSGDRSRGRNSRRSTNSSALNLSVQSDSDEESQNLSTDINLSSERKSQSQHDVVDLSSSNVAVTSTNSKSNSTSSSKRGSVTPSNHQTHTPSPNQDHHNSLHNHHAAVAERDRLISSLNSLLPNAGNHLHHGLGHPLNHLNHLNHHLGGSGKEISENHHLHHHRGKDQSNPPHYKNSSGNPLGMSNELLNNLNNMHKSVDLMAAAAAAAAASGMSNNNGPSGGNNGGQGNGPPHSRKAMQPLKRERSGWNPVPMAAQLVNNASSAMTAAGKRRVQCSVCLKTFCDKGALKIHFSAVHLREMHKCTVAGCNMMFSSRRSRNRHSANPNPKLHSPHLRRKISPHDGRSSQPLINLNNPMLFPGSGMRFPPFLPGMMPQNGGMGGMSLDGEKDDKSSDDDDDMELKHMVKMERGMMMDGSNSEASFSSNEAEEFLPKSSPSNDLGGVGGGNGNKKKDGARKRKSNPPVRLSNVADDSNDEFCCYDDGTVVSHEDDDIEDDADESRLSVFHPKGENEGQHQASHNGHRSPEETLGKEGIRGKRRKSEGGESVKSKNRQDSLRRLSEDDNHNHTGDKGVSGLTTNHEGGEDAMTDHLGKLENLPIFNNSSSPIPHVGSDSSKSEEDEGDRGEAGSPNSNGDIPIDPENPRKCLVCSKEFQNHFGVKTHYQNVHLKLMHRCIVDGCNAAFPSKRSRDRHASNLNLHRKLLSTSDNSNHGCSSNDSFKEDNENPLDGTNVMSDHPPISNAPIAPAFFNPYLFHTGSTPPNPTGLPSQALSPPMANTNHLPQPQWNPFLPFNIFPTVFGNPPPPTERKEGVHPSIVDCRFCGKSFVSGPTFLNHLESSHPEDVFRCKCSLVFDSVRKLESHSKKCVE